MRWRRDTWATLRLMVRKMSDMPLNQQDIDNIVRAFQASQRPENLFTRFQPTWAALAIIGAIFIARWQAKSYISTEVTAQISPLQKEMSEGFKMVNYSLNGNPETGTKGLNERMSAIETRLPNNHRN